MLMTTAQAAEYLGLKPNTLEHWRSSNKGPNTVRISSRTVRYRLEDLQAWIAGRVEEKERPR